MPGLECPDWSARTGAAGLERLDDAGAAEHDVAVVEDDRLPGCDCALRFAEADGHLPGLVGGADRGRNQTTLRADADLGVEWRMQNRRRGSSR